MTTTHDDSEVFARHVLAARKRTLRHLLRALEGQALQLAIAARQGPPARTAAAAQALDTQRTAGATPERAAASPLTPTT